MQDLLYVVCGLVLLAVGAGMGIAWRSELSSTVMVEWIQEEMTGHIAYHAYDHTGEFSHPDPSATGIELYKSTMPISTVGRVTWMLHSLLIAALGAIFVAAAAGWLGGEWIVAGFLLVLANTAIRAGSTQLRKRREIREALTHVSRDREATAAAIVKDGVSGAIEGGVLSGFVAIVTAAAAQAIPPREQGSVLAGIAIALGTAAAVAGFLLVLS